MVAMHAGGGNPVMVKSNKHKIQRTEYISVFGEQLKPLTESMFCLYVYWIIFHGDSSSFKWTNILKLTAKQMSRLNPDSRQNFLVFRVIAKFTSRSRDPGDFWKLHQPLHLLIYYVWLFVSQNAVQLKLYWNCCPISCAFHYQYKQMIE